MTAAPPLTGVGQSIRTTVTTITPRQAADILARGGKNRRVKDAKVEEYAGAMKRGEWLLNGETVVPDTGGRAIQGRHRLLGGVKSDTPFPTVLVEGIDLTALATFDTGSRRSLGDVLSMNDEHRANRLAAALRMIWVYNRHNR